MFLKLLLLLGVLYLLYKAFGGNFKIPKPKSKEEKEIEQNTLVECCECHIYITRKEAKKRGEDYYCEDCA